MIHGVHIVFCVCDEEEAHLFVFLKNCVITEGEEHINLLKGFETLETKWGIMELKFLNTTND